MVSNPKTFTLSLLSEEATLRTDAPTSLGEAPGNDFTVDFQLLYEVHGALDPGDEDNASLLVVRMVPLPRKTDAQFDKLNVQLSVNPVVEDDEDVASLVSFEPAAEGAQFVDVYTTNEERTRALKGSAMVPVAHTASFGLEASHSRSSTFTRTHLLRVKARAVRTDPKIPVRNGTIWQITAANKEQGIGDSFTVVMLIKRPQGSSFQLVAEVGGHIGTFSEKTGKIIDGLIRRRRPPTRLAVLPLDRSNARVPPGVLEDNLHRASTDNIMRQIAEVGLHLPELARPVTVITGATSSTSIDLAKITTANQAEDGADSGAGDEDDGTEDSASSEEGAASTFTALLAANSTSTPVPRAIQVASASSTTTTTENSSPLTATDASVAMAPPPADGDAFAHRVDSQAPLDPAFAATLTAILEEVKQLRPLADHPQGQKAALLTARRIQRLRETASLYERLAELHREEARELVALEGMEVDK